MEHMSSTPKSLPNLKRYSPISPSSARMLKKIVDTRDVSKLINLSTTIRSMRQSPNGENFELSYQLSTLRKNLDKYSVLNFQKESRIKELRMKLKELKISETVKPEDVQKESSYKDLKREIKAVQLKEREEQEHQMILESMFERMALTKDFLEKRERKLKKTIEKSVSDLSTSSKQRKDVIDSVNQYKIIYKDSVKSFEHERDYLKSEIARLETQSKQKKKLIEKTEEHNRHRQEIVELTIIEESSAPLEKKRNSYLLHKTFNFLIHKKISKEQQEFTRLNNAFQQIKQSTGISSVEDLIEKFLTREETYKEITNNVQLKEEELSIYHNKISDLQFKVNILSSKKHVKVNESEVLKKVSEDLVKLKAKKEGLKNVILKIHMWIEIVEKKVFSGAAQGNDASLFEKFKLFSEKVAKRVRDYAVQGVSQENEYRRKTMKLEEIIQAFLAAKKFRNSIQAKPISLKSISLRK